MNKIKSTVSLAAAAVVILASANGGNAFATFGSSYRDTEDISVVIDTDKGHRAISPYIYGINAETDLDGVTVRAVKQSDPGVSTYNWENNLSRGGGSELTSAGEQRDEPAYYTRGLVTAADRYGISSRYVTLQMMGLAAADSTGAIQGADGASRWDQVFFNKHDSLLSEPDLSDGSVYMDEYVSFLVNKYGCAVDGGINGYFLDNEPENWSERFPEAATRAITADELIDRSAELSEAVKNIDPTALVYGPSVNGIEAFINLGNPEDWETHGQDYSWFIDYYLDGMREASESAGIRLLDVLDVHYHTEATNGLLEPIIDGTDNFSNNTRLQAPRILWDSTYTENSTIAIMHNQHIPLIPTLEASINMYYPGTKLSFSEYNFGGGGHISGGIATADTLGIFATYGVHMACLKPNSEDISYQKSAINIYTDYDGNGNGFGDTLVRSDNGGDVMSSVYASVDSGDKTSLKVILINKNSNKTKTADTSINSDIVFESAEVYSFNEESPEIIRRDKEVEVEDNSFSFEMEPLTVYLLVFEGTEEQISIGEPSESATVSMGGGSSGTEAETSAVTTVSTYEHVAAETYPTSGTAVPEETAVPGTAPEETAAPEPEQEQEQETGSASETDAESADEEEPEGKTVPKGIKIAVCVLVVLVVLAMGFVIVQDIIANKKR